MNKSLTTLISDAGGLAALGLQVLLASLLARAADISVPTWLFLYAALAVVAVFVWHHDKTPTTTIGWSQVAAASLGLGCILFVADVAVGHMQHPHLPLIEAGTKAGGMFGFVATLAICPGVTIVALAALARTLLQGALGQRARESPGGTMRHE